MTNDLVIMYVHMYCYTGNNVNEYIYIDGFKFAIFLQSENAKMQEELKSLKSENNSAAVKLQEDNENLQKELGTKTDEIQEKAKMIIQVSDVF